MSSIIKPSRRSFVKTAAGASAGIVFGVPMLAKAAPMTVKLATVAPKNSTWGKGFAKLSREIPELSDGAVKLKVFYNGVQGDEAAMVTKMRSGQLDGAGLTAAGLGLIAPEMRMLQLPMLFSKWKQLDKVREVMKPRFDQLLSNGGVVSMGFGDVGRTNIYSNVPVVRISDILNTKIWEPPDPVAAEILKVAGVNGIPLAIPDLLPAMSTKQIDALVFPAYALFALQLYTHVTDVLNMTLSMAIGGMVLNQSTYARLEQFHDKMDEVSKTTLGTMNKKIRRADSKAKKAFVEAGIRVNQVEDITEWLLMSAKVRENLTGAGKMFSQKDVDDMLAAATSAG